MQNDRDTKFQGYAKLLFTELQDIMASGLPIDVTFQKQQELLAQRAYDLALHILIYDATENLTWIPDLTEWPATSEQNP